MHEQYWEELDNKDRNETVNRTKCAYTSEFDSFAISLLNRRYDVNLAERAIRIVVGTTVGPEAGFAEQLCILAYLVHAKDLPRTGKLVTAEKLDPGGFFFRGSHRLPVAEMEETFGSDPELLCHVGQILGATTKAYGDAAIEMLVLPRIPLTAIIWAADEEFSARASILFDQSASSQLPLDVLYVVAKLTVNSLITTAKLIA